MDKLNPLQNPYTFLPAGSRNPKNRETEKKKKTGFLSLVRKSSEQETTDGPEKTRLGSAPDIPEEMFREAIDRIFDLGEKLKDRPALSLFEEYKKQIRIFFNYVTRRSVDLEKQTGIMNFKTMKPPKEYTLIKIIDKKLEDLAVSILRSQKNQMEILEKVNEIHGLLIDLIQ